MRIIDVFNLMAEGKIEFGTKLVVFDEYGVRHKYIYAPIDGGTFIYTDDKMSKMKKRYTLARDFLNFEAELIDET